LHNDELHNIYPSPNIVRVIKSRNMRWAGHVAPMGEGRGVYRVLVGWPEGKRPQGRTRLRWGIILRWTWGVRDRWAELDSAGSGWVPVAGFCEHGDEPSVSVKSGIFFNS
jgi:hypothetical protein